MSQTTPPLFGHYVVNDALDPSGFINITSVAKQAGFYFPFTGISQQAYYKAIDVPGSLIKCSKEKLTLQLLKQVRRAARKVPMQSQTPFTVCQPPSLDNLYVNRSLDLIASIERDQQDQPMLIITTKEDEV
ncbi:hypothetical protein [uncultured Vibrio sp.]|uniref:hypothetical protein n=1 Tax=uncultured Vibrio sp. TaxID=114054 RepID=UPI002606794F|nr:hypothetical protein [uncultured Vibrio sp.]